MPSTTNPPREFYQALREFAATVAEKFQSRRTVDGQPEAQLVGPVEDLLLAAQALSVGRISITNESQHAESRGRPDLAVACNGLLQGYVELKAPGKGAQPSRFRDRHDRAQWEKFRYLPNIVYTDGTEWALYQEGRDTPVALVRLGSDVTAEGASACTPDKAVALGELIRRFFSWEPIVPRTAKELAMGLARLCRYLREDVMQALTDQASNLREVMREWQARLFPDVDEAGFADAYAQTVTYALLLARTRGLSVPDVARAVQALEPEHGLLGQALQVLTHPSVLAEIRPAVDVLFRYVLAVDPNVFAPAEEEPWLYFYEDFLAEYDPELRRDFGVYYTPAEVVRAQVTLVSDLLRRKFQRRLGFADDAVTVLDPAVGTGTYLIGVIQDGIRLARAYGGDGYVPDRATAMAANLYGFERLVGPYAVAHLRVSHELLRHGARLPSDGVRIYLTDTLESPRTPSQALPGIFGKRLSEEHARALQVKATTPILVCLGNPPYDRHTAESAQERGGWIRFGDNQDESQAPLRTFIEPVRARSMTQHLKNLYNSYVYFWRWALWKVFEQQDGAGIVCFITASSYLRGPAFLGMREQMRRIFDELWIIDLGGDNLGARKTSNVFAIQTPVAIAIGARYGPQRPDVPAVVHYASLTDGTREEKLERLNAITGFDSLVWESTMEGWHAPFLPARSGVYWSWPLLTDIFPWQHSGVETKRTWVIAPDRETLRRRWAALVAADVETRRALFRETRDRKLTSSVKHFDGTPLPPLDSLTANDPGPVPERYSFRSFDRQWILVDNRLGDFLRPALWHAHSHRQVYLTSLLTTVLGPGPAATVCAHVPDLHHFSGRGGRDIIPLWRDRAATQPNVTRGLLDALSQVLGIQVDPEDLFAYCYAILSAPQYTERFGEELLLPGPRIPITQDPELFVSAVQLGRYLIGLHTYGERFGGGPVPQGKARIEEPIAPRPMPEHVTYEPSTATLHVGTGAIRPVSEEVWEFSVSGYQVLERWLGYRLRHGAGRQSSELDSIRPTEWLPEWTTELLELIWILEATVALWPKLNGLLEDVVRGPCFEAKDLPAPDQSEKRPPDTPTLQESLVFDEEEPWQPARGSRQQG